jgi:hypothetical protein
MNRLVKAAVGAKATPAEDCTKQHQTRLPEDQILWIVLQTEILGRIICSWGTWIFTLTVTNNRTALSQPVAKS